MCMTESNKQQSYIFPLWFWAAKTPLHTGSWIPTVATMREAITKDIIYSSILHRGKWRPLICSRLWRLQMGGVGLEPRIPDSKSRAFCSLLWVLLFWHWETLDEVGDRRDGDPQTKDCGFLSLLCPCFRFSSEIWYDSLRYQDRLPGLYPPFFPGKEHSAV